MHGLLHPAFSCFPAFLMSFAIQPDRHGRNHEWVREEFVGTVEVVEIDRVKPDVLADEVLEFAGGDFAEALEARDLVGCGAFDDGDLVLSLEMM